MDAALGGTELDRDTPDANEALKSMGDRLSAPHAEARGQINVVRHFGVVGNQASDQAKELPLEGGQKGVGKRSA